MRQTKKHLLKIGWFRTGDLARIDKDGYIYIQGRKKFVIVLKNGKNVYPEEIESLINKSELIKESMENITEEEIRDKVWKWIKEVNKTMPKYKYVKKLFVTDEEFIKTTTLKIKRNIEIEKILKNK